MGSNYGAPLHTQDWTIADGESLSNAIDTMHHGWGSILFPTLDVGAAVGFQGAGQEADPRDPLSFATINTSAGAAISITSVGDEWTGYTDELASVIAGFRWIKLVAAGNQTGAKAGKINLKS